MSKHDKMIFETLSGEFYHQCFAASGSVAIKTQEIAGPFESRSDALLGLFAHLSVVHDRMGDTADA